MRATWAFASPLAKPGGHPARDRSDVGLLAFDRPDLLRPKEGSIENLITIVADGGPFGRQLAAAGASHAPTLPDRIAGGQAAGFSLSPLAAPGYKRWQTASIKKKILFFSRGARRQGGADQGRTDWPRGHRPRHCPLRAPEIRVGDRRCHRSRPVPGGAHARRRARCTRAGR